MTMNSSSKGLTAHGRKDVENEIRELVNSVLNQAKIPTMDKKLIVEAATPGHYPAQLWEHFGIKDMPQLSVDGQADAIIQCAKAGAAAVHCHVRDPLAGYNYEVSADKCMSVELIAKLLDRVYKEVDMVPLGHAWHPKDWQSQSDADYITPTKELLDAGKGNKYMQGGVVITWIYPQSRHGLLSAWHTADSLRTGISYLEANNIKPLIALHSNHLSWFIDNIVKAGVFKGRPHINIQEGKHAIDTSFCDPMSFVNIINTIELVKKTIPDSTIGIHAGGRNWLPITTMGIMLGVDLVRVGIEDQFWMYPHKDEFIKRPSESVKKVVEISRALGRDIATAAEAREILGIKVAYQA